MKRLVCLLGFTFTILSLYARVEVSGHITTDTTWSLANSPYIVTGDVYIDVGATLTIEAGTIIKFEYRTTTTRLTIIVNGRINPQGTASNNVIFTSLRDDSVGGDDNMDGSATRPAPGDWGCIQINSTNNNLSHCTFRYGGYHYHSQSGSRIWLWINNSTNPAIEISDCTFEYAFGTAIYYDDIMHNATPVITNNIINNCPVGIHLRGSGTTTATITDNIISGSSNSGIKVQDRTVNIIGNALNQCGTGVSLDNAVATIYDNSITNSTSYPLIQLNNALPTYLNNTITGSGPSAIGIGGTISANRTLSNLQNMGLVYAVISDIIIASGATLTIEAGTIIKFEYRTTTTRLTIIVNGRINPQGTASNNVIFTSLRDDSVGGDDNMDGSATRPAPGDWGCIQINSTNNNLEHCTFRYGGYHYHSQSGSRIWLWINNSTNPAIEISDCTFEYAFGTAIYYDDIMHNATPVITNNIINNCPVGIHLRGSGTTTATLANNRITNSVSNGIYLHNIGEGTNIRKNTISDNGTGIYVNSGAPNINENNISNNSSYGVNNNGSSEVNATGNYWGDSSGPYHSTLNPDGKGNQVSDKVNFSQWTMETIVTLESVTLTFLSPARSFSAPALKTNAKSFIYFYYDTNSSTAKPGSSFHYSLTYNGKSIPSSVKILDAGIVELCVDLGQISQTGSLLISIPESITSRDKILNIQNRPTDFRKGIQMREIEQNIDLFAEASLGGSFIAGGVGAGPSIAAARFSLSGSGGVGITFKRDIHKDQYVSRRFEASITGSVSSPAINAVAGKIQLGLDANITQSLFLGQTMLFPEELSNDIRKKAKAAYILETLILANVARSPVTALVLESLHKDDPNVGASYNDLIYSFETGLGLEGDASIGFSVAWGSENDQSKLDILDVGAKFGLNNQISIYPSKNEYSFCLDFAREFSLSMLNLQLGAIDVGTLFRLGEYNNGTNFSLDANFSTSDGFSSLVVSTNSSSSKEVSLRNYTTHKSIHYIVPKSVISRNINRNDLLNAISEKWNTGRPIKAVKVGLDYFINNVRSLYDSSSDSLVSYHDHIMIENNNKRLKGNTFNIGIDLDAALGIGVGLELGLMCSYFDELHYPESESVLAHGKAFPLFEYNGISNDTNLFNIKDELKDLLSGTIGLIKAQLKQLVNKIEYYVDKGIHFIIGDDDLSEYKILGKLYEAGKLIIRVINPAGRVMLKEMFLESQVKTAYISDRIIDKNAKGLNDFGINSRVYFVSQVVNVNFIDNTERVVPSFDPLTLSLGIDPAKMDELGFGENEKKLAKLYLYDPENIAWIELAGNTSKHADTVTTLITKSGSYAVGIEINPEHDIFPPQITDYFPRDNDSTNAYPIYWAKLIEGPTEVGVDLSRTSLFIDGREVSASWDPTNKIISYSQTDSLSLGLHTFNVVATDYNGNQQEISSTFRVVLATTAIEKTMINNPDFEFYPNPTSDFVTISFDALSPGKICLDVYNQGGQKVATLINDSGFSSERKFIWDLTDNNGKRLASGIYFLRMRNNERIIVKKLIIH